MGRKGNSNLFDRLTNMAFASPGSRQILILSFLFSMILNAYFMLLSSTSSNIQYESPDHFNAAQSITYSSCMFQSRPLIMKEIEWDKVTATNSVCLCGVDNYCRCGPSAATDIIAFTPDMKNIILVDRKKEPLGLATVGGFVEVGESIESAAIREFKEETNLEIAHLKQVKTYSSPHQDPRRPAISTVFIAKIESNNSFSNDVMSGMQAGDDAAGVVIWPLSDMHKVRDRKYEKKFGFQVHRRFILDAVHAAVELNWIKQSDIHQKKGAQ